MTFSVYIYIYIYLYLYLYVYFRLCTYPHRLACMYVRTCRYTNQSCLSSHPKPQTPNPKPQTPNPKPQTPNPKPQTPNPKPQTPNQTLNPKPIPSTAQPSALAFAARLLPRLEERRPPILATRQRRVPAFSGVLGFRVWGLGLRVWDLGFGV